MSASQLSVPPITALCLAVTLLAGCGQQENTDHTTQDNQSFNVVVEPVQMSNERTRVEAVGTSRAIQSIILYPATSGECP